MTDHEIRKIEVCAYLYSAKEPTELQKERLCKYLEKNAAIRLKLYGNGMTALRTAFALSLERPFTSGTLMKYTTGARKAKAAN